MGAWIYWHAVDDAWREHVLSELRMHVAIQPVEEPPVSEGEVGIVCSGRLSSALCGLVHRWSGGGRRQVLLVAANPAVLEAQGPWSLLGAGAADVLVWDEQPDPGAAIAARLHRWTEVDALLDTPFVREHLVGSSPAWMQVLRQVIEVARFTDAPVLLLGETGTGKEQLARLIHLLDPRPARGELVIVDCTTIVPELAGSELFGHERGAFTGAVGPRDGAFALADGGTLFLDEIGELPLALQAQLLRATQEHTYKRVGGNTWRRSEFRLVCATNRDLSAEVEAGRFRRDLYYRIAGWVCRLPSLEERREDILPLTRHFMRQLRPDQPVPALSASVQSYLLNRSFPGNVRDLRQLAARLLFHYPGEGLISAGAVPDDERPAGGSSPGSWRNDLECAVRAALAQGDGLRTIRRIVEDVAVQIALTATGGNLQQAARMLGVTDRALQLRRAAQRQPATEAGEAA